MKIIHKSCGFLKVFFILTVSIIGTAKVLAQKSDIESKYPIIPTPQHLTYGQLETKFSAFNIECVDFPEVGKLLNTFLLKQGILEHTDGIKIKFTKQKLRENKSEEAYHLLIDSTITIDANTPKGAFYAVQTLKQLLRLKQSFGYLPTLKITDWPAFKIRGLMHDTGRNFQSIAQLKEQIEVLAQYKMNVFHWHLTDNPAWRLESKMYPELKSYKATSRGKGDFYSQEEFKDFVKFCKERFITVIPEFDIPGHSDSFRKAFGFETMQDEKVLPTLLNLFEELGELANSETMPYIHIGTDEVRNNKESVSNETLLKIMKLLKEKGREVIVWEEGVNIKGDTTSINQLWAQHDKRKGHRFIDSRANYINHLDPFTGMNRLFFQQPTRQSKGDDLALGGILCAWPDNRVSDERDILKQNPIYPAIVFYSDAIWKGRDKNYTKYWANLPPVNSSELNSFKQFEKKVLVHRDRFFTDKEFTYVKQTNFLWKVIGPFNNGGDVNTRFPVEEKISNSYKIGDELFKWSQNLVGGTVHFKHFFDFPALTNKKKGTYYAYTNIYSPTENVQEFWIGFQGWSRSGGRRGGPFPSRGQWHTTNPKIWVNNKEIAPPVWQQPDLGEKTDEIPFVDEDYFFREPTKVNLKKGWNKILLKVPQGGNSWKWMFTCVPVNVKSNNTVSAPKNLLFNPELRIYSDHYFNRKSYFEATKDTNDEIIFLGNSITEAGDWKLLFPNVNAINRGISGDVTDGILFRLDEIISSKPKKIFLLIGTNDLARGKSVSNVVDGCEEIITQILAKSKNTTIFLQSILPVNPEVGTKFSGHKSNQEKIQRVNEKLRELTLKYNITYIDLHSAMSDAKGKLKTKYTSDGLHLSRLGYIKWAKTIKKHVIIKGN